MTAGCTARRRARRVRMGGAAGRPGRGGITHPARWCGGTYAVTRVRELVASLTAELDKLPSAEDLLAAAEGE